MIITIANFKPNCGILQRHANIWFITCQKSHYFITSKMREQHDQAIYEKDLPPSAPYLAKTKEVIGGFSKICGEGILISLFIHPIYWRFGIKQKRIYHVINLNQFPQLTVYEKNQCATDFYLKKQFLSNKLSSL